MGQMREAGETPTVKVDAPRIIGQYKRTDVADDDQWHVDPNRRRTYWLHSAAVAIEGHIARDTRRLGELHPNIQSILTSGEPLGPTEIASYFARVPRDIRASQRTQAVTIMTAVQSSWLEKGFRARLQLLTPREHREIGSSGFGGAYYQQHEDVPIPVLRGRAESAGKIAPGDVFTIEEADRARRLLGMTRLDPATGNVTDKIDEDASRDPYFFLTPERRTEIIVQDEIVLAQVDAMVEASLTELSQTAQFLTLLDQYSNGELGYAQIKRAYIKLIGDTEELRGLNLTNQLHNMRRVAFETGKRDRMLTPQEILIRTGGKVDARYRDKPFTPLGIQDRQSVDEIVQARGDEEAMIIPTSVLGHETTIGFRLEELEPDGSTISSPTFLDRETLETLGTDFEEYFKNQTRFPYSRPEDWHYNEEHIKE